MARDSLLAVVIFGCGHAFHEACLMGNMAYCPVCGTPSNVSTKRATIAGELQAATRRSNDNNDEEKKAAVKANESKRYMRRLNRHFYQVSQEPSKFAKLQRIASDIDLAHTASPSLRLAPPDSEQQQHVIGTRTPGALSSKSPHVRKRMCSTSSRRPRRATRPVSVCVRCGFTMSSRRT